MTSLQDADGRVRDFTLDNLGRVAAENWMNGNTVVAAMNYGYDLGNELTSASDPNSAYAFAYNGDGQVTSTDNSGTPNVPHVVLTAGYDLAGDMTSQSATIAGTKDFLNNYFYDADQRLTTVQQEQQSGGNTVANKEIDYAFNAIGQFTAIGYYNQFNGPRTDIATGAFSYDTDNRLTSLAYTANGGQTSIDSFGYAYNAGSLVTSFTSNDGTASYGYDPTNQLTSATYTTNSGGHQPANESYSFTNNGNRNMTGWTTGNDNTITSDGTFNYSHDADGNQTVRTRISNNYASDYRTTYSWDYRNRLTDVEYFDNNPGAPGLTKHVHYVYDVFNSLIATQVDTTGSGSYNITQRYIVTGGQPVLEFDNNGNLIQRNLVAPDPAGVDAIMAQEATSTGAVTWMLDDNLGTPRDIVNSNSQVVNHMVYAGFGQDVYESNSAYVHWNGFGGSHNDAYTGLDQNGRRWYDPSTGKWLSHDPIGFLGGDTDLSRAVGNHPTSAIDPTGLMTLQFGWHTDVVVIFGHVSVDIDFGASWDPTTGVVAVGPSVSAGKGFGFGLGVSSSPAITFTTTPTIGGLAGPGWEAGGFIPTKSGNGFGGSLMGVSGTYPGISVSSPVGGFTAGVGVFANQTVTWATTLFSVTTPFTFPMLAVAQDPHIRTYYLTTYGLYLLLVNSNGQCRAIVF